MDDSESMDCGCDGAGGAAGGVPSSHGEGGAGGVNQCAYLDDGSGAGGVRLVVPAVSPDQPLEDPYTNVSLLLFLVVAVVAAILRSLVR